MSRGAAEDRSRTFWYFSVPDHPIAVSFQRAPSDPIISGGSLLDITCNDPSSGSYGGVRVISPVLFHFDEQVTLRILSDDAHLALTAQCVVRTIRPSDTSEHWVIGCIFKNFVDREIFDACVVTGTLSRRCQVRHPVLLSASAIWEGNSEATEVLLTDVGYGGFGFECPLAISRGAKVQLRISEPDCDVELAGEVRWCSNNEGAFLVGCMFNGRTTANAVNQVVDYYRSIVADPASDPNAKPKKKSGGILSVFKFWK